MATVEKNMIATRHSTIMLIPGDVCKVKIYAENRTYTLYIYIYNDSTANAAHVANNATLTDGADGVIKIPSLTTKLLVAPPDVNYVYIKGDGVVTVDISDTPINFNGAPLSPHALALAGGYPSNRTAEQFYNDLGAAYDSAERAENAEAGAAGAASAAVNAHNENAGAHNERFAVKADKLAASDYTPGNILIAGEGGIYADSGMPLNSVVESWTDVQRIVRAGMAPKIFSVGEQFECKRGADTLTWDIIGFDHDIPADPQFTHSMTIQMHDCYKSLQYDATEALYYAENELPPGTYNFSLLAGYDVAYGGGKTYYFTLTQPVPAGGQIIFPWGYQIQSDTIKISTYASRTTTTAIESNISVTEGNTGTPLNLTNHTHRIRYGSNNYSESAMRQWLNSNSAAGGVWTPKTIYDRPPSWVNSEAGFLNGIDADFLAVVGAATKRTAKNAVNEGGGYYDITTDKIFLLSRGEIGGANENGINEGVPYEYYADMLTGGARNDGDLAGRIKYLSGTARNWWLRSPYAGNAYYVRYVGLSGAVNSNTASSTYGAAPACNII